MRRSKVRLFQAMVQQLQRYCACPIQGRKMKARVSDMK